MILGDGFHLDVSKIDLVHEFVLDRAHRCEYPHGRGMYGIVHCISGTAEFRFDFGDISLRHLFHTYAKRVPPLYCKFQGTSKDLTARYS